MTVPSSTDIPLPNDDAIRRLLAHLPTFRRPAGELFVMRGGDRRADGAIQMPYSEYVPEVEAFLHDLGRLGFVVVFPWPDWEEGRQYLAAPDLIADASLEECVKLFTTIVRSARFSWGEVYGLEQGYFRKILERLEMLLGE